ncbi:MAG: ADP-ribosylglycohydrolase family protein [Pseudomonadota bacterium]
MARARLSLEGLSIGDAFGERFFGPPDRALRMIEKRMLPASPWAWTDDTAMALSIVDVLDAKGGIDRDALAAAFASRHASDPDRGYGGAAHDILAAICAGTPWREAAGSVFDGHGSMGNGSAMRVAPLGAYFADDLEKAAAHARASADPTHAHPDGAAGAVAVVVAAAVAWQIGACARPDDPLALLEEAFARTPDGPTRDGIAAARALSLSTSPALAAGKLGSGRRVICSDTVPFALWCAARHLDDYEHAMWSTVSGLGDRDTTCAIVGGIVAVRVGEMGLPPAFRSAREPLAT